MNGYSVENLLVGKYYASYRDITRKGIIKEAVRRDDCLLADKVFSVRVTPSDEVLALNGFQDFWATVWIAED